MAAITLVSGIGQAVMGYQAQQQQFAAQKQQYELNAQNARDATMAQYRQLDRKMRQESIKAEQEKFKNNIQTAKAAARAKVAAAEGGVSGVSVDNLIGDIYGQSGRFDTAVDANLETTNQFLQGEKDVAEAGGQSQINSVAIPTPPNPMSMVVDIFSAGASAGAQYQQTRTQQLYI